VQYNYDGFMQYFSKESNRDSSITIDKINEIKNSDEYKQYRTGGLENSRKRVEVIAGKVNE
ncbi:DUF262 domain-containing protein, partial [Streptococcus pneumoniae]